LGQFIDLYIDLYIEYSGHLLFVLPNVMKVTAWLIVFKNNDFCRGG